MSKRITLVLTYEMHQTLLAHLFPGDGNEAAGILICKRVSRRFLVRDVICVPHEACAIRAADRIVWPGQFIEEAIDRAEDADLSIILIHSHPGGWLEFSGADNDSDTRTMPGLFAAFGKQHGSAIMAPSGAVRARIYSRDLGRTPVNLVTVAGHDIRYWWDGSIRDGVLAQQSMAFSSDMRRELEGLAFAVVGVSGTGSIVAEQLARLGVGRLVLVDFDRVERKNLNRILNTKLSDAELGRLKVDVFADAIAAYRGPNVANPVPFSLNSREAVLAAGECDAIFCCVDTQEARQIADLIASAFLLPLFDVGVVIPTRSTKSGRAIADVVGRIDYVFPGGSTLGDRGVYTPDGLRAEYVRSADPVAFERELNDGYLKGIVEQAPSVIALNARASSALVMEYIARAFPFRHEPNSRFARSTFSLAAGEEEYVDESEFPRTSSEPLSGGDDEPLLGLPSLARRGELA